MSEFIVSTTQKTPPDIEICELTATITDAGVAITAKSPIIAEFIAAKATNTLKGNDYVASFNKLIYIIPARLSNDIGGNGIYGDMFLNPRLADPNAPRGLSEPNIIWIRTKGLAEGVTLVFPQPAHIPADLIEYLNRSMEKTRIFYMKHIRKISVKSTLVERVNGKD